MRGAERETQEPSYRPTAFTFDLDRADGIAVIRCGGEVDLDTSRQLQDAFERAWGSAVTGITIDMTDVTFIDSSGIRRLLECARASRMADLRFTVVASDRVSRVARVLDVADAINFVEPSPDATA